MVETTPRSLSGRTVEAARALLTGERRGLRGYLAFVGPAVVASIAYVDPGNFATNIQRRAPDTVTRSCGSCCSPT